MGPPIWTMMSMVVLDMLRAEGYGIQFQAALSGKEMNFVGYGFVDDTDLVTAPVKQSTETPATVEQVVAQPLPSRSRLMGRRHSDYWRCD